jgi:hypothetical protein
VTPLPHMQTPSQRRPTTAEWAGAALLGGLVAVLLARYAGAGNDQLGVALRWTARWSFLWFWLASCSAALGVLFGAQFRPLAARARQFGLAFAAAHLVHVALVAYMLHGAAKPFAREPLIFFGTGVFFVYLMALLSLSGRLRELIGAQAWRAVRVVGLEYINYAYYSDFSGRTFHKGVANLLVYLPFLSLVIAGPLLRLAAAWHRGREPAVNQSNPSPTPSAIL